MDPQFLGVGIIALGLLGLVCTWRELRARIRHWRVAPDLAAARRLSALPPHRAAVLAAPSRPIDRARAALQCVQPDDAGLGDDDDSTSFRDDLGLDR